MSVTGLLFLFCFLPFSLALYYCANDRGKEWVLLFFSLFFYAVGSPRFFLIFVALIGVTILLGRVMAHTAGIALKRALLVAGIILNAGILVFFKYFASRFAADERSVFALLPLGISFFTFKAISYLADIYKGRCSLAANPVHDALYLSFFPQVQSGPLTRYGDMRSGSGLFSKGCIRFMTGFAKKVLLANMLVKIANEVFAAPSESLTPSYVWLGSVCYSLQIFFDFAGYSDMAIGLSGMFGYPCMENFDYPYMTESVARFWRRWHISLSRWFRDYIYIPLGGSRVSSKWRVYFNLLVVWLLTGIWHGSTANFVAWGLGFFVMIALERLLGVPDRFRTKAGKICYRIFTLFFINCQWILFRAEDFRTAGSLMKHLFVGGPDLLADHRTIVLLRDYSVYLGFALLFCFPIVPWIERKVQDNRTCRTVFEVIRGLAVLFLFAVAVSFVVSGQNNPFVYANF